MDGELALLFSKLGQTIATAFAQRDLLEFEKIDELLNGYGLSRNGPDKNGSFSG